MTLLKWPKLEVVIAMDGEYVTFIVYEALISKK
jgi:hypothetical protein